MTDLHNILLISHYKINERNRPQERRRINV